MPAACPSIGIDGLLYRNVRMDITAGRAGIDIAVKDAPTDPLAVRLDGNWRRRDTGAVGSSFSLAESGVFHFDRP